MTGLAIREKEKKTELRKSGTYFRSDYIGIHLLKSFFQATIAFALGLCLWILLELDYVVDRLGVLDLYGPGIRILLCYGAVTGVYLVLTYVTYAFRYHRAEKERDAYNRTLLELEREYTREGRRIDRMSRTKGDNE